MKSFEDGGIEGIIFDLDETLIDAQRGLRAAHEALAKKIIDEAAVEEKEKELIGKISKFDDEMNRKTKYDRNEWWPILFDRLDLEIDLSRDLKKEFTKLYWETYEEEAISYDYTVPILNYLKKKQYLVGLLTDTDNRSVPKERRVRSLPFYEILDDFVICGEDTEKSKPSESCFKEICSRLNLNLEDCCMVGDKPFTDIKGANSMGMKTVLIKRRNWDSEIEADITISNLKELKEVF